MPAETESEQAVPDPSKWIERYGDLLFRYAMLRVGQRDVAEDLVQETMLAGLRTHRSFQGKSTEQTWLVSILRRKIADHFRTRYGRDALPLGEVGEVGTLDAFDQRGHWKNRPENWPDDPSQVLEDREFWRVFEECLARLPPPIGAVFRLREFEQTATEEVCKVLEISATNLRVRLYRARMLMRRCLELHWFSDSAE